jgi:hypothetical protein
MAIKISGDTVIDDGAAFTGAFSKGMKPNIQIDSFVGTVTSASTTSGNNWLATDQKNSYCALSTSTFIIGVRNGSALTAHVITVDGSYQTTVGSAQTLISSSTISSLFHINKINSTTALLCYTDTSTNTLYARVLTVSGTTITTGAAYTIDSSSSSAALCSTKRVSPESSATRYLVGYYVADGSSYRNTKVAVLDISGTVVSVSSNTTVFTNNNTVTYPSIALYERDDATISPYTFVATTPSAYSATWSRDSTGLVTITYTGITSYIADNTTAIFIDPYLEFTSGSSPPSNAYYTVYAQDANTLQFTTTNTTASSGNVTIYNTSLNRGSFSLSGSTISSLSFSETSSPTLLTGAIVNSSFSNGFTLHQTGSTKIIGSTNTLNESLSFIVIADSYKSSSSSERIYFFNDGSGYTNFGGRLSGYTKEVFIPLGVGNAVSVEHHIREKNILVLLEYSSVYARMIVLQYSQTLNTSISNNSLSSANSLENKYLTDTLDMGISYTRIPFIESLPSTSIVGADSIMLLERSNNARCALFPTADKDIYVLTYSAATTTFAVSVRFKNFSF